MRARQPGGATQGKGLEQGAGDQGLMFGYATDETPELMPLPIFLAHRLARKMAEDRHAGREGWLRPDAKTQVSVLYDGGRPVEVKTVLVSTMHEKGKDQGQIAAYVREKLAPQALAGWHRPLRPAGPALGGLSLLLGVTRPSARS